MKKLCLIFVFLLTIASSIKASEIKANQALIINTFDGKNFDLKEKIGKIVIINFWAKWCVDCRKEMLILEKIYNKYKSQNLEIIGISIDDKREYKKVLEVASTTSYQNAMFVDAKEISFEEPNAVPTTYVIGKDGKIITEVIAANDEISEEDFEKILQPLLK